MRNQQMIIKAHIWFVVVLVAFGLLAVGGRADIMSSGQNANQNMNGNMNMSQNRNSNRSNRNTGTATGEQTGMGNLNSHDRDFMMDAAIGGLEEVELGKIAAQQGTSEAVKQFGQRMVDDHSKASPDLMTVAQSKGITLPTTLDEKHRDQVKKLQAMTGADFDRAYSKLMLSDHKKDVSEFEKQSTKGTDPDLKAFASRTLPTLQEHLSMAQTLPGNESSSGNTNSGGATNSNRNRNSNRNSNSNRP